MKHIGNTIKNIIEDNHLVKAHVANQVGITPTYLAKIFEKGSIDCALLDRFCKALNLKSNIFFDDDTESCTFMVGNVSAESFLGSNIEINQGGISALKALLAEKERTIQLLLKSKGFYEHE